MPSCIPKNIVVPITLSICQQSRAETLKHYSVVKAAPSRYAPRHMLREISRLGGGFIFSPKRDTAVGGRIATAIFDDHEASFFGMSGTLNLQSTTVPEPGNRYGVRYQGFMESIERFQVIIKDHTKDGYISEHLVSNVEKVKMVFEMMKEATLEVYGGVAELYRTDTNQRAQGAGRVGGESDRRFQGG